MAIESFAEDMIIANADGVELGSIEKKVTVDLDIGDTDDFELQIHQDIWDKEWFSHGSRIFIPGTEYGGIINEVDTKSSQKNIILKGSTWRGLLKKKIVKPPEGKTHLILNGDLNDCIRTLMDNCFGPLYVVLPIVTGIQVNNWKVERYITLYDALLKLVSKHDHRLKIQFVEPEDLTSGYIAIGAVPIVDYSNKIEYPEDGKVSFSTYDYRGGINHLICLGKGEGTERVVIDLYVNKDGKISYQKYYTGYEELEAVYDNNNMEEFELEQEGIQRLLELKNYKKIEVTVDDVEVEIGDIIGGYESITETYVAKPIVGKILKISDGKAEIEYKVKGDD